ncbi:hypothetical protein SCHPADRAFT_898580 [Schizopora paradoxa]|uniref:F-box domain-containing protein n=1 Tax=Schizopora paradoxa TaxID=27342 RepID=A0A0H2S5U2_9AGAM|nr:hypothetical protein SCHPADRAFT_898580 [Schizopora paradoxa]
MVSRSEELGLEIVSITGTRNTHAVAEQGQKHKSLPPIPIASEMQIATELVALILSFVASMENPAIGEEDPNELRPLSVRCRKEAQPLLYTSSLVSKLWNDIATELLYENVYVTNPKSLSILSTTLKHRKDLRTMVRRFFFVPPKEVIGRQPGQMPLSSWLTVKKIHSICPHLESRTIKQSETRNERHGRLWLQKRFLSYTHPLNTGKANIQSLTRLELESIRAAPGTFIPESLVFPQLQDLTLKGFNTRHFNHSIMVYPTMPQLVRLRLKDCSFYGVGNDVALPKNCPRLRVLEIVGGCLFQSFWVSLEKLASETHIESLTYMPLMCLGTGRPPVNNLQEWLPDLHDLHIKADCFVWESNTAHSMLLLPRKVRRLVIEAPSKVNHNNLSASWVTTIQDRVQWLLECKDVYGVGLESIVIWAFLDKVARDRHSVLVRVGEREDVQVDVRMFDKTPKASTKLMRVAHKLSPMF